MKLRAFFSPGSGTLLWTGDDASRARWLSVVALAELGLSEELRNEAARITGRYDALFDFNAPATSNPLVSAEGPSLLAEARAWLAKVRTALGAEFEIEDGFERR